jgi:hypothetical protein
MDKLERVGLVHRLREAAAQAGFTRFEAVGPDIGGELDLDVERAPLGLDTSWLPVIENRGEGIFIQFKAREIERWPLRPQVIERDAQLRQGFGVWRRGHEGIERKFPEPEYSCRTRSPIYSWRRPRWSAATPLPPCASAAMPCLPSPSPFTGKDKSKKHVKPSVRASASLRCAQGERAKNDAFPAFRKEQSALETEAWQSPKR